MEQLIAFALLALAADPPDPGREVVSIKIWLYRIRGDISGESSLTDDIREGVAPGGDALAQPAGSGAPPAAGKGSATFFTVPKLVLGGVKLEAGPDGWTWDGRDGPPEGGKVERLEEPTLNVLYSRPAEILVSSADPIQYFERRPDGLFELRSIDFSKKPDDAPGISCRLKAEKGASGRVLLRDFTLKLRSIERRKPVEGVRLDVGEPVIAVREHRFTMSLKPGRDYGVLFPSEGTGSILLRLRLQVAKG